jgi:molecular chaperone GrpE (heat shock protein)
MEMNPSSARLSPEERSRIVRGFEAWLDRYLDGPPAEEEPPPGLTPELLSALENGDPLPPLEGTQPGNGCDLYSLWAAMTALAQEVRLQGRTFKQLHETLIENARTLETTAAATIPQAEARQPRKQEIDVLLDLRDRMERGRDTARSAVLELAPSRLPRLARWLGVGADYAGHAQEILAAISQGYSLTLDSLDEALVACHVSRIACQGKIFDPQCMTAVAVEEIGSVPEGTVVEVYRNGYEWNGEVYRSSQVKVARPANKFA